MKAGEPCPACGAALVTKELAVVQYRGALLPLHPPMVVPVCMACGDMWLDTATVRALGARLEAERQKNLGAAPS